MFQNFFGGYLHFPEIENLKKFVLMSKLQQRYDNNANFKQNYTKTVHCFR